MVHPAAAVSVLACTVKAELWSPLTRFFTATTTVVREKGDFRRLWIQRISAASRLQGPDQPIQGLKAAGVEVDRRMLAVRSW